MNTVEGRVVDRRTVVKTTALFIALIALVATGVRALVAQEINSTAVPPTLTAVVMLLLATRLATLTMGFFIVLILSQHLAATLSRPRDFQRKSAIS